MCVCACILVCLLVSMCVPVCLTMQHNFMIITVKRREKMFRYKCIDYLAHLLFPYY